MSDYFYSLHMLMDSVGYGMSYDVYLADENNQ